MSGFDDWYLYGEGLARSLVAVAPEFGSTMFAQVMNSITSSGQSGFEEGRWHRVFKGYVYHGPEGGDNHYQREPPAGVAHEDILDASVMLSDQLIRELDHFIAKVETAAAGESVQMHQKDGQAVTFQATGDELARLQALAEMLRNTRAACQQNYNQAVMFRVHTDLMQLLQSAITESGGSPKAIVDLVRAGAAMVIDLRWQAAADARLTALFYVQTRLCELALEELDSNQIGDHEVVRLASMMIAGLRGAPNPEHVLTQSVIDFSRAGLGNLVLNLCDETLSFAEREVEAALNATDLLTHSGHLYSAAHIAFAGMSLAEGFREHVAQDARPDKATDSLLEGYATSAEEIVVRTGHALVINCINRATSAALNLHINQVRLAREEGGLDKAQMRADTLINDFYFYPHYYAKTLMGEPT
ncbi:MAG TPA: hypothetical protein VIQ24_04965 [Pyrinomonadaceae bacterium]